MSRAAFEDELDSVLENIPVDPDCGLQEYIFGRLNKAVKILFAKWLAEGRYKQLASWFNAHCDCGGGDDFILPMIETFTEKGEYEALKKLLKGSLAVRHERYKHFTKYDKDNAEIINQYRTETTVAFERLIAAYEYFSKHEEAAKTRENFEAFLAGKAKKRKRVKPTDTRKMTPDIFWELIADSRIGTDSVTEQADKLTTALTAFGAREVAKFDRLFYRYKADLYRWDHWALVYIIRRGCSTDAFEYYLAWIIGQGQEIYALAKADINTFAEKADFSDEPQAEELCYVGSNAYETLTGNMLSQEYPDPGEPAGTEWPEDDLPKLYPAWCAKFGY